MPTADTRVPTALSATNESGPNGERPGPVATHHHLSHIISLRGLRSEIARVDGLNAKIAVLLTRAVGTMWMAYLFAMIALLSLPAILVQSGALGSSDVPHFLVKPGLILIVAWIAQTFIQLVLLSVIMVGQSVQSAASDARAVSTFDDTETIIDALNTETAGGLKLVLDAIAALPPAKAVTPRKPTRTSTKEKP